MEKRSKYTSAQPNPVPQNTNVVQDALLIVGKVSIDQIIKIP